MSNSIDRQQAIDEMVMLPKYFDKTGTLCLDYADVLAVLSEHLPSVEPEREKGKWIVVTRHEHYPSGKTYEQLQCPFCNRIDHNGDGNFCGYCGADMREKQDV